MKTALVINGKIKKFPSLLSQESIDDTAFDAVSSKLADHDGAGDRTRTGILLPARDFKSLVSTISPHRQVYITIYHSLAG